MQTHTHTRARAHAHKRTSAQLEEPHSLGVLVPLYMQTSAYTTDVGALQKCEDFVRAYLLGFDIADAVAVLRLDDLYVGTLRACSRSS